MQGRTWLDDRLRMDSMDDKPPKMISLDSKGWKKWSFLAFFGLFWPSQDKVLKVLLRGDASRIAYFRAPASPRGTCTGGHRCEVRVPALGTRPQSAGISLFKQKFHGV